MNKEIKTLIKIQGKINKNKYHLHVHTDLQEKYRWVLFLNFHDERDYFSNYNNPIMESDIDTLDDLKNYLEKHDGFNQRW